MLKVALGSVLLVTATQTLALSLGGAQGSVIIGRPLDILVQGSIDAAEAASGLCLDADVSYGDVRLPASAISVAIQRLGADGKGALRVRANTPVNEPIVAVAVKAGCPANFTRSYTLLADFEAAPSPAVRESIVSTPVAAQRAGAVAADKPPVRPGRAAVSGGEAAKAASNVTEAVPAKRTPTPVRLHAPRPRPVGVAALASKLKPVAVEQAQPQEAQRSNSGPVTTSEPKSAAMPTGPRLKLDPVDVASVPGGKVAPIGQIEKTTTVVPTPTPELPTPSDAVQAITTAENGSGAVDGAVQKELQGLRDEQERMRLAMETMNRQLTQAEQSRYNNPLVYGLGGLVLALAGGFFWLSRRRSFALPESESQSAPWWTVSQPDAAAVVTAADEAQTDVKPVDTAAAPVGVQVDTDLPGMQVSEASESVFLETPIAQIDVASLVDLWQQVAFFESLGQHSEAAYALETFVRQYPRGSEAPYLFWLQLADQQGDDKAYAKAQSLYEQHYHRLVPTVQSPAGLESDAGFMRQLTAAWPEADALSLVERALVSQPGEPASTLQIRTAQSFDDLLVLHGVLELMPTVPQVVPESQPADEWITIKEVKAAAGQQLPSVAQVSETTPSVEDSGSMLDFHLPQESGVSSQEAPKEPTEEKKELPALDFDFHDLDFTPTKK